MSKLRLDYNNLVLSSKGWCRMEEEKKPILYIALGDSLTEGVGAQRPNTHWVAQFFDKMKHSDKCNLRNLGISGITSAELSELLSTTAFKRLIPKASHISVTIGGNDFIQLYEEFGTKKSKLLEKMDEVSGATAKILERIRELNPDAQLYLMGFFLPIPAYTIDVDLATITIKDMNKYYKNMCKKLSANLINPFDLFLNRKDYFHDEVHPNQEGYNKLASLAIKLFEPKK